MKRVLALVLVGLLLLALILATVTAEPAALETVVAPKLRPAKHLILVLDRSCSMGKNGWSAGRAHARMISEAGVDQAELSVVTFSSRVYRWRYHRSHWTKLPSKRAVDHAQRWLGRKGTDWQGSFVGPALKVALEDGKTPLSVVLISDGKFSDGDGWLIRRVAELQKARRRRKLGNASIICLQVERASVANVDSQSVLWKLGKRWGGGLYRARTK